jgi:glycerate 2-kinase
VTEPYGGTRGLRADVEAILRAAIEAAHPAPLVRRALASAPEVGGGGPIRLVALGKAAPIMADEAFELLGDRIVQHVIVAPRGTAGRRPVLHGGHPLPDADSVAAGGAIRDIVTAAAPDDVVLVLLSGGGSAAAVLPLDIIEVDEYAGCIRRLMRAGADIAELNTVRRHIDGLKGGRMAVMAQPATVLGLVLSDVVGDALETIASGPLSPDPTSAGDALRVLRRYGLVEECAESIHHVLTTSIRTGEDETPGPGAPVFERVRVRVIGGNDVAVTGAARAAEGLGYTVHRAVHPVTGAARSAGEALAGEAVALQRAGTLPACIVAGGESTVMVRGGGRGGRNQELVLAACIALDGAPGIALGSAGTDGVDGPTDAAGAVADAGTLGRAAAAGADPDAALRENDSHSFFRAAGGLIVTGPTGTNVNDVHVALVVDPVGQPD